MMAEHLLVLSTLLSVWMIYAKPMISEKKQIAQLDSNAEQTKSKIFEVLSDQTLTWKQRNQQIDSIYDSIPAELLPQIPISNPFNQLPHDIYQNIKNVYYNDKIDFQQRRSEIRKILENITWNERLEMQNDNLPAEPPAGFDEVLGEEIHQKLIRVHKNPKITVKEKKALIDDIMSKVPKDTVDRLPMPIPIMKELPDEIQREMRQIMYNFSVSWDERLFRVRQYVRTLAKPYRRLIRFGRLIDSDKTIIL